VDNVVFPNYRSAGDRILESKPKHPKSASLDCVLETSCSRGFGPFNEVTVPPELFSDALLWYNSVPHWIEITVARTIMITESPVGNLP
jgi:hypothetical protein